MLTEACLGGDLFSVLENHGALHIDAMRYVIGCVIEALDHLHRILSVIHRDVKTENILLDSNGEFVCVCVSLCSLISVYRIDGGFYTASTFPTASEFPQFLYLNSTTDQRYNLSLFQCFQVT